MPVELGIGGQLTGWPTVVFALGLGLLITLWVRKVKGAIIISILVMTVVAFVVEAIAKVGPTVTGVDAAGNNIVNPTGWNLNVPAWPSAIDPINFGTLGEFNLLGSFERVGIVATILLVFTLMLADFFDTMGTMTAIGAEAGLLDEDGTPPQHPAHPRRRLARRGRRWRGRRLVEHLVHRVGLGCRRGRAHRPGLGRHRRAVPACRSS